MTEAWKAAVASGNGSALAQLVRDSAQSVQKAISVLEGALSALSGDQGSAAPVGSSPSTEGLTQSLCTLTGVQLLQPRGRFDLEFRERALSIAGKAGSVTLSWDNLRHIIRLPRPEGYSWGKMDSSDPAGSDLLALPLKQATPFRKNTISLVLVQPDPKAKQDEVSFALDGVSHKLSGSQGTVISDLLALLSKVKQRGPDKSLFVTRDGKSFVKCYHGVNEGSLFPLTQGLLFMKPGLFLPSADIGEVVCGRGGSAQTRYVDLVVGMQVDENEGEDRLQYEFSNIPRDYLNDLQHYIQTALVAPRQREAKRAEKADRAAEQSNITNSSNEDKAIMKESSPVTNEKRTSSSTDRPAISSGPSSSAEHAQGKGQEQCGTGEGGVSILAKKGASRSAAAAAAAACSETIHNEDCNLDSDEDDEDFAVSGESDSDGDDSGSDSDSDASGGDDDDDDYEEEEDDEEDNDHEEEEEEEEKEDDVVSRNGKAKTRDRVTPAMETQNGVSKTGQTSVGGEGDGDVTESDGEEDRPRKRAK